MKVLYLDESGHPNLAAIDPDFPIFVLGGVIVEQDYADGPLTDAFNAFKREMFGASDIVLHTADIVRNRNGFEALLDSTFRARFYQRIEKLELRSKRDNLAGLQLADLVVTPIARHLLGKVDNEDWRIIESKIRGDRRGMTGGYGLRVLPTKQ